MQCNKGPNYGDLVATIKYIIFLYIFYANIFLPKIKFRCF